MNIRKTWQKLSIRTQLIILMVILLSAVGAGTLLLVSRFDIKERRVLAIEQASALGRSINNDLLKALINTRADTLSDISFRIEGFKSVDALQLYNNKQQAIFSHGKQQYLRQDVLEKITTNKPFFDANGRLFIKLPVTADDFKLGDTIIVINPEQYNTRIKEKFITLMLIFPFIVGVGIFIAWRISRYYTKPFEILASAIYQSDIDKNKFISVKTRAKNEIGLLFNGYNRMISKIIKTTDVLRHQSQHDKLTGLYNRYAIEDKINQALQDPQQTSHVLLNLDIDQFKNINDSVGHVAGDELLQLVTHYLKTALPAEADIARTGGDDFIVLLKNTSLQQATTITETLLKDLSDFRFVWDGETLSVSASIGLVAFKPFEYTLTELLKVADVAFYNAKKRGQNKLHIHRQSEHSDNKLKTEINIASAIKEALKEGPARFELFAQDIVPLQKTTDKISYEILLRMWDSNGDFLPPDQFLPTAERYQLMVDIDIHVLTSYLEIICKQPEHINKLHSVHINLAGGTLNHPEFQACVKNAIQHYTFPWQRLELEVTETSSIGNLVQAEEFIRFCRQHGIGFALDDFGTGMSSFEYLKNLPFDVVKIDGSFVRDMLTDPVDHAMIRYTNEISKLRNQETVAEYVESREDVEELRKIGITYGQGYYLGKPRPLSEWLDNN